MKGVSKYYPGGDAAVQALIAGNDMLCLPDNVPVAIESIRKAIRKRKLKWSDIDKKVKRVLYAKYQMGLNQSQQIDTTNLVNDLNKKTDDIRLRVGMNTVTVLKNSISTLPFITGGKVAYVAIGSSGESVLGKRLHEDFGADYYNYSFKDSTTNISQLVDSIERMNYDRIIIEKYRNYSLRPAGNYGISENAIHLTDSLQSDKTITLVFGNVYAAENFCKARTLVVFKDDEMTQHIAADFLQGGVGARSVLLCFCLWVILW